jgi:hypothetical protein
VQYWLESCTLEEIIRISESKKDFGKLRAIDALVIRRIADAALTGGGDDFSRLIDRWIGKPMQQLVASVEVEAKPIDLTEIARRTAFLLSLPRADDPEPVALLSEPIKD